MNMKEIGFIMLHDSMYEFINS